MKYGNMKKKQSDVMRKRMMGVRIGLIEINRYEFVAVEVFNKHMSIVFS